MREPSWKWLRAHIDSLKSVMSAPFDWFTDFGELHERPGGKYVDQARHIYIDRGAEVLGVAHLDSVQVYDGLWLNKDYLACATIDNRLGAWLMLYGLPDLGMSFDVLLTENEEWGLSTAADFVPTKEYNWAFSFDRSGDDVACYHYHDAELKALLASYGLPSGHGSYSDVADLELGVKGMNFGCGMYNYHAAESYANLKELLSQVEKFGRFYADQREVRLPHIRSSAGNRSYYGPTTKEWDGEWSEEDWAHYNETGYSLSYPLTLRNGRRWDLIDSYHGRRAIAEPHLFFGDYDNANDWHWNHRLGDVNEIEMDDQIVELYGDGVLVICEKCENLFARSDVDKYVSLDAALCKACFYYEAVDYGLDQDIYEY